MKTDSLNDQQHGSASSDSHPAEAARLGAHTREPWFHVGEFPDNPLDSNRVYAGGRVVAQSVGDSAEAEANAARIVACVNACALMVDPGLTVAALYAEHSALRAECDRQYDRACRLQNEALALRAQVARVVACLEPHGRPDLKPEGSVQVKSGMSDEFWRVVAALRLTATESTRTPAPAQNAGTVEPKP